MQINKQYCIISFVSQTAHYNRGVCNSPCQFYFLLCTAELEMRYEQTSKEGYEVAATEISKNPSRLVWETRYL